MPKQVKPNSVDALYASIREAAANETLTAKETMGRKVEDLLRTPGTVKDATVPKARNRSNAAKHPKGWEPGVKRDKNGIPANIVSPEFPEDFPEREALKRTLEIFKVMEGDFPGGIPSSHRIILAETRLGADWERINQADDAIRNPEKPSLRFRWTVVRKEEVESAADLYDSEEEFNAAAADAIKGVRRAWKPVTFLNTAGHLVIPLGDLQAGQHDGDSVEGLMLRAAAIPLLVKDEVDRCRRSGKTVNGLLLPILGDLVEGVVGFYANQTWLVRLSRRRQAKLVRRLLKMVLKEIAKIGLPMIVPVVPGNHGQFRGKNGKPVTDLSDNEDLTVVESVQEVLHEHERYRQQITFLYPEDGRLTLTFPLYGLNIVCLHGDVTGYGSGEPAAKMKGWIKSQAMAGEPAGEGNVFLSGHFHTATFMRLARTKQWLMCPAACDESEHFSQMFGLTGGPGLMTAWLDATGISNVTEHRLPTLDVLWPDAEAASNVIALHRPDVAEFALADVA